LELGKLKIISGWKNEGEHESQLRGKRKKQEENEGE
jgi:hypothetical protein